MAIKLYTKEYAGLLQTVFESKQRFMRTFGGSVQVVDGVTHNDTFMEMKIQDTDVTIQPYSTDPNVAFGTGTENSSRFGERNEVKSVDTQVAYEAPLAIHDGVDSVTVNDNAEEVIALRAKLHAEAWTEHMNQKLALALSENASLTIEGELSEDGLSEVFARAYKEFVNNRVSTSINWVAYVNADVYDYLVSHKLTTQMKSSNANVENQTLTGFKGFILDVHPDAYFQEGEQIIFAADNVGVVGVGLQVYRLFDSEAFAGVAIQSAAKYGKHIPEENKKAILKATLTEADAGAGV